MVKHVVSTDSNTTLFLFCFLIWMNLWYLMVNTDSETSSEWHKLRRFRNKFGMTRCSVYSGFDKLNHHTFFLFFDTNDFWIFSGEYRFRKKFGMTECFRRFIFYNSYFVVYASSGGFDTALPTQPPRVAIMVVSTLHRFVVSYFMPHTS